MGLLSSLRILDFSSLIPGPVATLALADLGADVIRIESPLRPDLMRLFPPYKDGESCAHTHLNRSKRSLALNLKSETGINAVKRLIKSYDILIEQFRPGVMEKLGLGYAELKAINPDLIYCSISGYGQTGPYAQRAGHDINYLAVAGILGHNGRADSGPMPPTLQLADVAGGSYHAVMSILAAVINRSTNGGGQHIDVSLMETAFSMQVTQIDDTLNTGRNPGLETEIFNGGTFYDCYETRDGRYMSVAAIEPHFFTRLCEALGFPELAQFAMTTDKEKQREIKTRIKGAIKAESYDHWCKVFADIDACVEPVPTLSEAFEHPQIQAREMFVDVPFREGTEKQPAFPVKFSNFKPDYAFGAARAGEHSRQILEENGFSPEEILAIEKSIAP
ncbi:MAG: CoA transferase [Desulfobacterales bacterium]|nr:CoA transferase [Desulfobacterales bacterium]